MDRIDYLEDRIEKADMFISQIEEDCSSFVDEIIDDVCEAAIACMNSEMQNFSLCDDFPTDFSFFDQLSVLHQYKDYNEMGFPLGYLEEYIENTIAKCLDGISRKDKVILWYSDCHPRFGDDYEIFDARESCICRFNELQNNRYEELLPELE